jgi:D-alanyl-D-alanine carboxypeptidase
LKDQIDQTLAIVDIEGQGRAPLVDVARRATPLIAAVPPRARPETDSGTPTADKVAMGAAQEEIVTRMSTSGGRHYGINVGRFKSRHQAERILLQTALIELGTLDEALRKVVRRSGGFDANFVGLSEEQADLACRRLSARQIDCAQIGPGSG